MINYKNCGDKMNNNLRKEDKNKESLYLLYLCIVEDIGIKRFNEIQEEYFNNKFNWKNKKDLNRFIEIAINYE